MLKTQPDAKLTIRVTPAMKRRLKVAAAQDDTSLQDLIHDFLMGWLSGRKGLTARRQADKVLKSEAG